MFSGEYEHSIDDKGRLIIPARLRSELPDDVFITRGLDGCVFLLPIGTWNEMANRLSSHSMTRTQIRFLSRLLFSGNETTLDKQGRISIPAPLRDYSGIEPGGEVVIIGLNDRIELWNKARWTEISQQLKEGGSDLAAGLEDVML